MCETTTYRKEIYRLLTGPKAIAKRLAGQAGACPKFARNNSTETRSPAS